MERQALISASRWVMTLSAPCWRFSASPAALLGAPFSPKQLPPYPVPLPLLLGDFAAFAFCAFFGLPAGS